jgi:hypothetical protein
MFSLSVHVVWTPTANSHGVTACLLPDNRLNLEHRVQQRPSTSDNQPQLRKAQFRDGNQAHEAGDQKRVLLHRAPQLLAHQPLQLPAAVADLLPRRRRHAAGNLERHGAEQALAAVTHGEQATPTELVHGACGRGERLVVGAHHDEVLVLAVGGGGDGAALQAKAAHVRDAAVLRAVVPVHHHHLERVTGHVAQDGVRCGAADRELDVQRALEVAVVHLHALHPRHCAGLVRGVEVVGLWLEVALMDVERVERKVGYGIVVLEQGLVVASHH